MAQLTERIILRLTTEDYAILNMIAQEHNTTLSKYVRGLIHDDFTDTDRHAYDTIKNTHQERRPSFATEAEAEDPEFSY